MSTATVGLLTSCAAAAPDGLPSASTASSPAAASALSTDAVGPLFPSGTASAHTCTAAVVASRSGDVVMTAAHCLAGTGAGLVFVPGYRSGQQPHGAWTVTAAYAPSGWLNDQDTDDDVAFLVLAPRSVGGVTTTVQQSVGGFALGPAATPGLDIDVVAYDAGIDDAPVRCTTTVHDTGADPTFDCHGFSSGTSGAPWLAQAGDGYQVVGIIGGRRQGGCREQTSFSPTFGSDIAATLAEADRDAGSDTLPTPPDDGC